MADEVERAMESMLPELHDLKKRKIFTDVYSGCTLRLVDSVSPGRGPRHHQEAAGLRVQHPEEADLQVSNTD